MPEETFPEFVQRAYDHAKTTVPEMDLLPMSTMLISRDNEVSLVVAPQLDSSDYGLLVRSLVTNQQPESLVLYAEVWTALVKSQEEFDRLYGKYGRLRNWPKAMLEDSLFITQEDRHGVTMFKAAINLDDRTLGKLEEMKGFDFYNGTLANLLAGLRTKEETAKAMVLLSGLSGIDPLA